MIIVVDSREQCPYVFEGRESIIKGLKVGDYSIEGMEDEIALERKTHIDAYGSIGHGRERFERELVRLSEMRYAAIIIETTLHDFLTPPPHSLLNPKSAIGSLLAWSVKFRLPVFFCGDRAHGQAVTLKLLEKFHKYKTSC